MRKSTSYSSKSPPDRFSFLYCSRMDLDMSDIIQSANERSSSYTKENMIDGTVLPIGYFGYEKNRTPIFGESHDKQFSLQDYGLKPLLGLHPTPNSDCNCIFPKASCSHTGVTVRGNEGKGGDIGSRMLQLGISNGSEEQILNVEQHIPDPSSPPEQKHSNEHNIVDDGSTSSALRFPLLVASNVRDGIGTSELVSAISPFQYQHKFSPEPSAAPCSKMPFVSIEAVANIHSRRYHPKKCRLRGCSKRARGALRLCTAHGGGRRCCKNGCSNGFESKLTHCKPRRCRSTNFCIGRGGGQCKLEECTSPGHGKSSLLIKHSGEKRSSTEGCLRCSNYWPTVCRRCEVDGYMKAVQEKRWIAGGCMKRDEPMAMAMSDFCTVHGGTCGMEIDQTNLSFHCPCSTSTSNRRNVVENGFQSSSMNVALEAGVVTLPPTEPRHSVKVFEDVDGLGSNKNTSNSSELVVPEGRVHGGRLMFMLGGSFANASLGSYGNPS